MATKLEHQIAEAEAEDLGDEEEAGDALAPDEAEIAAGEEDDEATDAGAAEEPEQEASSHAIVKQLEGEHTRHHKALVRILGDGFAGYADCPLCFAMGYVPGPELSQNPRLQTCPSCSGRGAELTGSLNPEFMVQPCHECAGNGYITRPAAFEPTPVVTGGVYLSGSSNNTNSPQTVEELRAAGYTIVPPYVAPVA